jgi:hypothetical protein
VESHASGLYGSNAGCRSYNYTTYKNGRMVKPTGGQCYLQGKKVSAGDVSLWSDVGYITYHPLAL